jgi:hypothetical protein
MKSPARIASQPLLDLRMFVGGVVVDDGVDRLAFWHGGLGSIEKADERLMAVALHAAPDHRAIENVEGGKQSRCAIALVIVPQRPFFKGRPGCVRSSA